MKYWWFLILCCSNHISDPLTSDQTHGWICCLQVHKIWLYLFAFQIFPACKALEDWSKILPIGSLMQELQGSLDVLSILS